MTAKKNPKSAVESVKSTAKKVAKKVDKAVVEPVADLFRSKGKSGKKGTTKSKSAPSKKTKK